MVMSPPPRIGPEGRAAAPPDEGAGPSVSRRTRHKELLINCARIGFDP